ncbi:Putative acyl-CoA oxidase family protein [Zea mays]|uniref:Putative acyl-CoA oxidase family protein n=1 Tax=Zea mays TaxID=4577 RepID=A0A1D6PZR6_MAIZE|nr:Putative acyl-CoA oxidase family protein [Zea mays]
MEGGLGSTPSRLLGMCPCAGARPSTATASPSGYAVGRHPPLLRFSIINGRNQGVHAFVAQIMDEDGTVLPNIHIADCGHKIGLNGVDNGRIWWVILAQTRLVMVVSVLSSVTQTRLATSIIRGNLQYAYLSALRRLSLDPGNQTFLQRDVQGLRNLRYSAWLLCFYDLDKYSYFFLEIFSAMICPVCRGIYNCSICRTKKGWFPTGSACRKAVGLGYKSVAHFLIAKHNNKQVPLI